MKRSTICLLLWAAMLAPLSCNRPISEREERATRAKLAAEAPESTRQQWAYLDRIRQRDALSNSIERTFLNDQHEIGLVLFASVTPDKVAPVVNTVMKEMAQKFPNEDVSFSVYAASTPPNKIGSAHLNGQSGETTYRPVK